MKSSVHTTPTHRLLRYAFKFPHPILIFSVVHPSSPTYGNTAVVLFAALFTCHSLPISLFRFQSLSYIVSTVLNCTRTVAVFK
ncbi:hypothetical protein OH77DRAFT_1317556 [Trametes cingulata]|nr:hypothetical protein OH77DRAFT_1317556 [Trametes cingulata]